jgi:hypothetical protein
MHNVHSDTLREENFPQKEILKTSLKDLGAIESRINCMTQFQKIKANLSLGTDENSDLFTHTWRKVESFNLFFFDVLKLSKKNFIRY